MGGYLARVNRPIEGSVCEDLLFWSTHTHTREACGPQKKNYVLSSLSNICYTEMHVYYLCVQPMGGQGIFFSFL